MYFYVQVKDNALCLVCRQTITTCRSCNLKRHLEQKHNKIKKLSIDERKAKLRLLKMDSNSEQNVFQRSSSDANVIVNTSLHISQIIAIKVKPLSYSEYIKEWSSGVIESLNDLYLDLKST